MFTPLVNIIFALRQLSFEEPIENARLLWHRSADLGKNGDLFPRNLKLFDRLANNLFIGAAGVDVGRIPGGDAYGSVSHPGAR